MQTNRHTTHSSFLKPQHQGQVLINRLINLRPLFFGAVFVFSSAAFADLKIAVIDTGFCSEKAVVKFKNHKVLPARDMTGTNGMDCKKITAKEMLSSGRFHGQKVLNEFLSYLPETISVTISPIVVYDRTGNQSEAGWRNAINAIEKEKIDMVLTASGFINSEKLAEELPGIWFVPSGRLQRSIDSKTILFPQNLAPKPNLFVIGDYVDEGKQIIYDQALTYQDQIDYYFPSGNKKFTGTSRAVSEAMARALAKCFIEKDIIAAHTLRLCLLQKEKTLKDRILKREFKTF
ncbi:MAG: hypothetical protein H7336_09025 [Bacteriovorax sp.]|nr:hypothetical protein [Bacteriovorax sp.]